jgi:hypothetical protein
MTTPTRNSGTMTGHNNHNDNQGHVPATRRKVRSAEDFDIIIGFISFWAMVLLIITVWTEVTAQPALGWALGLLAALLALYGMIRLRRKLPRRTATRHH